MQNFPAGLFIEVGGSRGGVVGIHNVDPSVVAIPQNIQFSVFQTDASGKFPDLFQFTV